MSELLNVINVEHWINENKENFLPPVCNKLMHNEQLTIMFVGGPNIREDYHIEEGEEMFYQIKGDMCVKIIENGKHKDIVIREGELFILPARVPHSPQRTANSVGLVIERQRLGHEKDGVKWFVPNTSETLYARWFHCKNLGMQLAPVIKEFFESSEFKTKKPSNSSSNNYMPFELNNCIIERNKHGAYNLNEKIASSDSNELSIDLTPVELNLQFKILILKHGEHNFSNQEHKKNLDQWFWQLNGSSDLTLIFTDASKHVKLNKNDSIYLPASLNISNIKFNVNGERDYLLKVTQDPKLALKFSNYGHGRN